MLKIIQNATGFPRKQSTGVLMSPAFSVFN